MALQIFVVRWDNKFGLDSDLFRITFGLFSDIGRVPTESDFFRPASDWGKGVQTGFGPDSAKRLSRSAGSMWKEGR
jgi:hypothetical protein